MDTSKVFWNLIEARRVAKACDHARIDEELWSRFGVEKAIVFTDLAGFTRNTHRHGIESFLTVIRASHVLFEPLIARHSGTVLKYEGDSLMVIFQDVLSALKTTDEMFCVADNYNATRDEADHVRLCVGIGFGKVLLIENHDLFGVEVNVASRLGEDIAQPGEVLLSSAAVKQIRGTDFEARAHALSNDTEGAQSMWSFSPLRGSNVGGR